MPQNSALHLVAALDGFGWHPAAWRQASARPDVLFGADYWLDHVGEAERGLFDFVTFEDGIGLQSSTPGALDTRTDQVRGRLDAVLLASRLAPLTSRIGLVPTANPASVEPFHLSTAIATLDYISSGRAGWRPQVSLRPADADLLGLRTPAQAPMTADLNDPAVARPIADLLSEAADVAEVVSRLWDSWQDEAVIRDASTNRFLDREKVHYIDFVGDRFDVKGPSITPRPPQGQPVVAALAHAPVAYEFAARAADVVFVTPADALDAAEIVTQVRGAEGRVARTRPPLKVLADLIVFLDDRHGAAAERKARLDELDGAALSSDAAIFTGTTIELAALLLDWQRSGLDGFRLRPAELAHDLRAIARHLVPHLQAGSGFRRQYETSTLRGHLGLGRPVNRYAASA